MSAFQFPDPTVEQTVVNPITGSTYQWKEPPGKWVVTTKLREVSDIIWEGDNPPIPIGDYKLWYSTDTLELYFYYCDANGVCAWVPTSAPITMLEDLGIAVAEINTELQENNFKTDQLAAILIGMEEQITNCVSKTGGDEMQGPFKVTGNPEIPATRDARKIETLGVFSGTASSALRLGTNRDRVYIGDSDTSFNGLVKVDEIGEKSAGNSIKFKNDIKMGQHQIQNLAEAIADSDAVPYGQIKRELTEKFEELTSNVSQGQYRSVTDPDPLTDGDFSARSGNTGNSYTNATGQITQLRFNKQSQDGSEVDFSQLAVGDYVRLLKGADVWQFRVDALPTLDATNNYYLIFVTRPTGPDFLTTGDGYQLSFVIVSGGSVDLDDYVKKTGDTMTGPLKIHQSAEAKLELKGNRENAINSSATIAFLNSSSTSSGYLTYRSSDDMMPFFKFNQSLDLGNNILNNVSDINFGNTGRIEANDNLKMTIRNGGNGDEGNAHVQIERPPVSRRGFSIRGKNQSNADSDIFYTYTNSSGGDAVNYVGKMSGANNILNRQAIEELIANSGDDTGNEVFQRHGPWHYAGANQVSSPGKWTTDNTAIKQIRQITFSNTDQEDNNVNWSDLKPGEVITIVQQGDFSSSGGDASGWSIVNYEVTNVEAYSSNTIFDVTAQRTILVYSSGAVVYNPSESFGFLTDTDTYVIESQPATLNNVEQLLRKSAPAPEFNVYKLSTSLGEPIVGGVPTATFINKGNNIQTPSTFIFSTVDQRGNGHKWGAGTISCPGSLMEFYRQNGDGTLCLCKLYSFNTIQSYGNGNKFEVRDLTEKHSQTNGNGYIPNPGQWEPNASYFIRFNFNFGVSTADAELPYEIDAEGDTHWDDHRLEDVGHPVAATDAATKGYVDSVAKSPTSLQYTLQYTTSSDSLATGFFFWLSTILMYGKTAGDRTPPELKVGDECRLVKEDGTAIILEVTERLAPTSGFFKFRVTNKTPGASIGNSEATDYFNLNFLYY